MHHLDDGVKRLGKNIGHAHGFMLFSLQAKAVLVRAAFFV